MELVSHVFPVKSRQSDEILVMPIGDIQWAGDSAHVALGMLKRHIKWGVERGAWFLGMGDYIDAFSPSNRQRLRGAALYDTANAVIEQKAKELADEVYEEALKPSKGRWLGMLEGHHYHTFASGITTDQYLADRLQAKFLGTSAYVRLLLRRCGYATRAVLIWCHHGVGAGQTEAAVLNRLKRMAGSFEGDIFLMGHLPVKVTKPHDFIVPVWPEGESKVDRKPFLIHKTKIIAGTGGFARAYVPGAMQGLTPRGGYAEQGMMAPASLGGVLIKIRPRWKKAEGKGGQEVFVPDLSVEA